MKHIPFETLEITDPRFLFGRSSLLKKLYDHAERLDKVELIGARRFGKTCLLQCLTTLLKSEGDHNAYPIYLDLHSDGIVGTENVYKYLSSKIISSLFTDGWINDTPLTFSKITIKPEKEWREVFCQFDGEMNMLITQFFTDMVEEFSGLLEQSFLLLFDEYEYMAKTAFDRVNGFFEIRGLGDKKNRPISYWIAGATPWREFTLNNDNINVGGSGEFNCITKHKYVKPLDFDSFKLMWEYECSFINDEQNKLYLSSIVDKVYESTGGVPFYAKVIGGNLCVETDYPDYTVIEWHLSEMEKMLSKREMELLIEIQKSPKSFADNVPASIQPLCKYGLLSMDNKNRFYIPIKFYADYLKAKIYDTHTNNLENNTINSLVDKIETLIYTINENWKRLYDDHMFDICNNTSLQYQTLRKRCEDRGTFSNFINAVYILHWEGSKKINTTESRLPGRFKNSSFRKAIDRLRHTFGNAHQEDKLSTFGGQFDKGTALAEFTGSTSEPHTPSDWLQLQDSILINYVDELEKLNSNILRRRS